MISTFLVSTLVHYHQRNVDVLQGRIQDSLKGGGGPGAGPTLGPMLKSLHWGGEGGEGEGGDYLPPPHPPMYYKLNVGVVNMLYLIYIYIHVRRVGQVPLASLPPRGGGGLPGGGGGGWVTGSCRNPWPHPQPPDQPLRLMCRTQFNFHTSNPDKKKISHIC